MTNELYKSLDDLVEENKELIIKLELADSVIANLRLEIKKSEDGQLDSVVTR